MSNESTSSYWQFRKIIFYRDDYNLEQLVEDLAQIPDDNEYGYFIECDLECPAESKGKTENFPVVRIKQKKVLIFSQNI